jgi:threonine/homoserine/homoserine lactone efflux protein
MDRFLVLATGYSVAFQSPLFAFVLTSLIIEMTPGPNMAYLAVLGASRGRLAGFSAVFGVALGLALLGIVVGLGGGSVILDNPVVYESLRWAGALYLCWLAYDSWRGALLPVATVPVNQSVVVQFRRGFITNLLNPKAALFFIAVVPEFTSGPAPSLRELAILISIYVAVATLVHGLIVSLAGELQTFFAVPQRRQAAGNIFCGCSLSRGGVAVRERRPIGHRRLKTGVAPRTPPNTPRQIQETPQPRRCRQPSAKHPRDPFPAQRRPARGRR